jgi:hypothetical protein
MSSIAPVSGCRVGASGNTAIHSLLIPNAFERHVNERAIVRLQRDPQGQLGDPVGAAHGSTLPRSLSSSNESPTIGRVRRVLLGPSPTFCVGAVPTRRVISGCERMQLLLAVGVGGTMTDVGLHSARLASAANLTTSLRRASTEPS